MKLILIVCFIYASWVAQTLKNLSAMQETQVQSLGWEDPLEKGMYSGLETNTTNFIDRGAWQATVHGVTKSQIGLSK